MTAAERRILGQYSLDHPRCELHRRRCAASADAAETHHVIGGVGGRPTEPWNLASLCLTCHRVAESDRAWYRHEISVIKYELGCWNGKAAWLAMHGKKSARPYDGRWDEGISYTSKGGQ